jgi:hypothetical protein
MEGEVHGFPLPPDIFYLKIGHDHFLILPNLSYVIISFAI